MLTIADTAYAIAAIRAEEHARPPAERLFEDPYAARFHAAGAHAEDGTRRLLELPFFRDGIRLRTRFIDDAFVAALDAGVLQVVILGAGFDARALRIAAVAARGARVFEVDVPEQLERKRAVLSAGGVALPASIAYVAADLAVADVDRTLGLALATAGYARDLATLFVWEGVTAYIGVAATDRMLRVLAGLGGAGSQVVFDVGTRFFHPETVVDHATRAGFASCASHGGDELWRRYLPGEPHAAASSFRVAVARRRAVL